MFLQPLWSCCSDRRFAYGFVIVNRATAIVLLVMVVMCSVVNGQNLAVSLTKRRNKVSINDIPHPHDRASLCNPILFQDVPKP